MEVKLKSLHLENFKCYKDSTFNFSDNVLISGQNAKGKTTLLNAFLWCLCGSDIDGKSEGDAIRPLGEPPEVVPSVTATLLVGGEEIVFKRELQPTYSGRGADKTYKGDATKCYIDSLPKGVGEYSDYLASIFPEMPFLWLDVLAFNDDAKFKAEQRRELLIRCFGDISEETIKSLNPAYEELFIKKGRHDVEEYRLIQKEVEKNCMNELGRGKTQGTLQARIDEAMRSIVKPELTVEGAEKKAADIQIQLDAIANDNNDKVMEKRAELYSMRNEVEQKAQDYIRNYRNGRISAARIELQKANTNYKALADEKSHIETEINMLQSEVDVLTKKKLEYEELLQTVENEQTRIETVCPTCGQPLPQDQIDSAIENYNEHKSQRLAEIEDRITKCGNIAENVTKIGKLKDKLTDVIANLNLAKAQVKTADDELQNMYELDVEAPDEIKEEYRKLSEELSKLTVAEVPEEVKARKAALTEELSQAQADIAQAKQNERQKERIAELQARQSEVASALSEAQRLIALCDDFILDKAAYIEQSISSHFEGISFTLFDRYKNGELKNSCRLIMDGKPYRLLSFSQKTLASVAVLKGLSEHYNFYAPMFIDNCSEMDDTSLAKLNTKSQTIIIKVSNDPFTITQIGKGE